MRRNYSIATISFLLTVALLHTACPATVNNQPGSDLTPLDRAEIAYTQGAIAYEFAMKVIRTALDEGKLSHVLWVKAYRAQSIAQEFAPRVRGGLDIWRASGNKPQELDLMNKELTAAWADISAVRATIKTNMEDEVQ